MLKTFLFCRLFFIILFCCSLVSDAFANFSDEGIGNDTVSSNNEKLRSSNKYIFGGGFGLQFGSVTSISISPMIGYKVKPNWFIAFQPSYTYYKESKSYAPDNSISIWGFSVLSRIFVYRGVFLHTSYEKYIWEDINGVQQAPNSVILGGGYCHYVNHKVGFTFMVGYDVLQEPNSYHKKTLIYQVGITTGF